MRFISLVLTVVTAAMLLVVPASAYVDLAGGWGQRFHEDAPERGAGPDIGDYFGLPINDAARLRADSWDAGKWTMLERQREPHPADYAPRGPASMRLSSTVDDPAYLTQEFVISSQFRKEPDDSKWTPRPCDIPAPRATDRRL